jgi:hypothetical protein
MSVAIGAEYRTGQEAPVSGRYDFVRHTRSDSSCEPTAGEQSIPLSRGETFPPLCGPGSAESGAWSAQRTLRRGPGLSPSGGANPARRREERAGMG